MGTSKKPAIPKSLSAVADLYYKTREERLTKQREADALEEYEKQLKEHLINNISKSKDSTGVVGKVCRVSIGTKTVPQVQDWDKLYTYIVKNAKAGSFALLNRAVNAKAVNEIWESGKKVPGVVSFNATTISINKL